MGFTFENSADATVSIRVVGVGGGGGNAVNRMITGGVQGIDFVAINTDRQMLNYSAATMKLQIGDKLTRGLGAGGNPEMGRKAAQESEDEIRQMLEGANMAFITAGMGGGTGTGGAPVVAQVAKDLGILTVGVVTRPFNFEGRRRIDQANAGISELKEQVDALVVIPNERLKLVSDQKITFQNAFEVADNVLRQAVQSISELMTRPGLINLDFNDVSSIMRNAGFAHMGVGRASGKEKAIEAAKMAIESPLLETSISGAHSVLLNITGSADMGLEEVDQASEMVRAAAHPEANIIFGAAIDESLDDEIRITVIATGFDSQPTGLAKPIVTEREAPVEEPVSAAQQQPQPAAAAATPTPDSDLEVPSFVNMMRDNPAPRGSAVDSTASAANRKRKEHDPFEDILSMFRDKN